MFIGAEAEDSEVITVACKLLEQLISPSPFAAFSNYWLSLK